MKSEYQPTVINGYPCVWLQALGWHEAKPAGEIVVGDKLTYNYGLTAQVIAVEPSKSGATVVLTVTEGGREFRSKPRRASTLVAVCYARDTPCIVKEAK